MRSASSKLQARRRIDETRAVRGPGEEAAVAALDPHRLAGVGLAAGDAAFEHPRMAAQQRALLAGAEADRLHRRVARRRTACRLLGARMRRVVHLREVAEVELGVDLRRRDVGVAEQLLHGAQVAARLQQVRRERVAQHVRMDVRRQPAAIARAFSRERTWLAVSRVPRLLTKSAASSRARHVAAQREPARRAPPAPARRPARCAACRPCRARARSRRAASIQPAAAPLATTSRPTSSPTRRPQPYSSSTMQASRAARRRRSPRLVAMRDQRHGMVDRQAPSAAASRRAARARRRPGWRRPAPSRPSQRYKPRHADSTSAMLRGARPAPCSCAAQRRTWCVFASRSGTRDRPRAKRCRRAKASPYSASVRAARRRSTCEVLEVARDVGVARAVASRHRPTLRGPSRHDRRQQPRQRRARHLADARQELGAHVGGVAGRVGRGEHEQAERAALARRGAAGSSPATAPGRLVEPPHRLEAGVDAAVRRRRLAAKLLHVVADRACANGSAANASAAPQTRIAACGIRNSCCSSRTSTVGQVGGVGGQHDRARPAMQPVGDGDVVLAVRGSSR